MQQQAQHSHKSSRSSGTLNLQRRPFQEHAFRLSAPPSPVNIAGPAPGAAAGAVGTVPIVTMGAFGGTLEAQVPNDDLLAHTLQVASLQLNTSEARGGWRAPQLAFKTQLALVGTNSFDRGAVEGQDGEQLEEPDTFLHKITGCQGLARRKEKKEGHYAGGRAPPASLKERETHWL